MNPADPADFVSPSYRHIGESLVRELGKLMADPEMVSLAGGYPGPELFDREGLRAAADEALREMPVAALQYGPTDGLPGLREQVARLLGARGTRCSAGDVLMTGGFGAGSACRCARCCAPATRRSSSGRPTPVRCAC